MKRFLAVPSFALSSLTLCLSLAGCASPPQERYYDLRVTVPAAGPALPLTVAVKEIAASGSASGERMAYRRGEVEVGLYQSHRWTRPPAELVRESLIAGLRASGAFQNVWEFGRPGDADVVLGGRLRRFEERDTPAGWEAAMSLDLFATDAKSGSLIYSRTFDRVAAAPKRNPEGVATAMSRLVSEAVDGARADLVARLAAPAPKAATAPQTSVETPPTTAPARR